MAIRELVGCFPGCDVCTCCRNTVEQQGGRLKVLEVENTGLKDQVKLMNESLSVITLEREELRTMNERSSAELRKALEVWLESHVVGPGIRQCFPSILNERNFRESRLGWH